MFYDKQLLIGQAYGNGDYINYSYDNLDRLTEIKYNDNENKKKTYIYGTDGSVSNILDTASNTRTKYVYDLSGRLVKTKEYSGADLKSNLFLSSVDYIYQDKTNYLNGMTHTSSLGVNSVWFNYGNIANGQMPDQVYNVWWNGTTHMSRSFDGLGRLSSSVINNTLTTNYNYKDVSDTQTTTQLQSMVTPAGNFTYTYDSLGNITSIFDGTYTLSYEYDSLNQLVRENDQRTGKTYTYTYLNGNITSKTEYAYTTGELGAVVNTINYGYGDSVWKDLLTSYNGMNITYDKIGNMTSFNGRTFNWTGRQLDGFSDGTSSAVYQYNMDGLRTKKVYDVDFTLTILGSTIDIDSTKTNEYFYNGSILAGEKVTIVDNKTNSTTGHTITFLYDENGDYFGFTHNGTYYYYIKNAQNDVVAIADSAGVIKVRYYYDSWGKIINTEDISGFDLATLNPIRYRSYYYDNESGYYYLQSRYYNPEIGRFINADGQLNSDMLGCNLFAYCGNNPINRIDSFGMLWEDVGEFFDNVTEWFYDSVVEEMKDSSNKFISYLGEVLDWKDSMDSFDGMLEDYNEALDKGKKLKEQYAKDVMDDNTKTITPDEHAFKDVYAYNELCKSKQKSLNNTVSALTGSAPTVESAVNFMFLWDPKTTIRIGFATAQYCLVVIFEGAFDLYG